jgi:Protein of unknown function (DUF3237)
VSLVRRGPDGFLRVDVRLQVETHEGVFLYVQYTGLLEMNKAVQAATSGGRAASPAGIANRSSMARRVRRVLYSEFQNPVSASAASAGRCCIHQWFAPSSTTLRAPSRAAELRAISGAPV